MSKAFVSFVSFVVVLAPLVAKAQIDESVGIRAQGMAGAFVAVADDATATWWNPAGLATGAYFSGIVEYGRLEEPRGDSTAAPAAKWRSHAGGVAVAFPALGLSYYHLHISEIRPPDTTAAGSSDRQDQRIAGVGLLSPALDQFGVSVGQSLSDHLVIASTLKLVRAESETHGDLDLGAIAAFGVARFGVSVRNLTRPEFGAGLGRIVLGRQARAGLALTSPPRGPLDGITWAFDADLTTTTTAVGDARRVAGGAEAWMRKRRLAVRGGLSANTVGEARLAVAGGISAAVRSGVYIDAYTTSRADQARVGWGIGLRVTF